MLGLTLLEAIITLAIVAVVIGLALPDVSSLRAQRATLLANHLVAAVHAARARALVYQATLSICPSQDGLQCTTDWGAPHLLVVMPMVNQTPAQVLYDITMPKMSGTLTWHGFGTGLYPQLNPSGDSFQHNGTWRYCSSAANEQVDNRMVVLSPTGKVTITVGQTCM